MRTLLGIVCLLSLPVSARAEESVIGEVVDTTCYLVHEGKGHDHQACARTCTQAGSPAAILDDKTGLLVYALNPISPENHHTKRPDERLLPFVGEHVKVQGRLFKRAGVRAIVVESVEKTTR